MTRASSQFMPSHGIRGPNKRLQVSTYSSDYGSVVAGQPGDIGNSRNSSRQLASLVVMPSLLVDVRLFDHGAIETCIKHADRTKLVWINLSPSHSRAYPLIPTHVAKVRRACFCYRKVSIGCLILPRRDLERKIGVTLRKCD